MKSYVIAALLAKVYSSQILSEADQEFMKFVSKYGRSYGTREEFEFRAAIFKENYEFIQKVNAEDRGYKLGVNFLIDRTDEEKKRYTGQKKSSRRPQSKAAPKKKVRPAGLEKPEDVDYRKDGAVTPVKNQGECASSWSFGVVGALEAYHQFNTGELVSLSEQQMIDCDTYNIGCRSGDVMEGYNYAYDFGVMSSEDYPYVGNDKGDCKEKKKKVVVKLDYPGHVLKPGQYLDLEESLEKNMGGGPVSVTVQANQKVFQFYESGILSGDECGDLDIDHAVVAVGFHDYKGEEAENKKCKAFAMVKNSWGTDWGEEGFANICISDDTCGITQDGWYPAYE